MTDLSHLDVVQVRAIIGGVRDVLGPNITVPGADLIALMETSLHCFWECAGEPASYAAFLGNPHGERAVKALVIAASLRSPSLSEDALARVLAYADAAGTPGHGFRSAEARDVLRTAWHERGMVGIIDVLAPPTVQPDENGANGDSHIESLDDHFETVSLPQLPQN